MLRAALCLLVSICWSAADGISFTEDFSRRTEITQTKSGAIVGKVVSVLEKEIEVYLGIPYAVPPLGELRFKAPLPIKPWTDVRDATRAPNSCVQELISDEHFADWNPKTSLSEDCLYLNVWVPKNVRKSGNASAMIWIHGGGYSSGSSTLDLYDAVHLSASMDIIVASLNYRVGPLGFLYLNNTEVPGNMGLLDQQLALQWIKDNVGRFGGDPDQLTIFGESAGAGSASYHLISPTSKHLSRRFILQSGCATAPWSFQTPEEAQDFALQLADNVGCKNNESIIDCMRQVPGIDLSVAQSKFYKAGQAVPPILPTIDGVFLPQSPIQLVEKGNFSDTEVLIGTTKDEGTMFSAFDFPQYFNESHVAKLQRQEQLELLEVISQSNGWSGIAKDLVSFQYTNWAHIENEESNAKMISDLLGDYFFTCPVDNFARRLSYAGSKVFYYSFDKEKSNRLWGTWMGASHGDDIEYVFGSLWNQPNVTDEEKLLSYNVMSYFSTFAKTGQPLANSTDWPEYSDNNSYTYMKLGNNQYELKNNGPRTGHCAFWNMLFPKLLKTIGDPSTTCPKETYTNITDLLL